MNDQAAAVAPLPTPPPTGGTAPATYTALERAHVPLLLVADPDEGLGHELVLALAEKGVETTICTDGAQALLRTGALHPDLVVVSASLPTVDAVTFVKAVRASMNIPLILGVSADDADQAVKALAAGANVCVARPYRLPELLPLIQGIRSEGADTDTGSPALRCGPIELDPIAHVVRVHGQVVQMPLREFELLHYLILNADRVVSRQQIQRNVWRSGRVVTNTINVHIRRLREKLGDDPENPTIILTVRGVGYRLTRP